MALSENEAYEELGGYCTDKLILKSIAHIMNVTLAEIVEAQKGYDDHGENHPTTTEFRRIWTEPREHEMELIKKYIKENVKYSDHPEQVNFYWGETTITI